MTPGEPTEPPAAPRLLDGWYRLPPVADGAVARVGHGDHEAVVWQRDGRHHGLDGWCPHRGAHLGGGTPGPDGLTCPLHGWRWAPDGTNRAMGELPAHPDARCPTVPVHDGHHGPLVWLSTSSPGTATHSPVDLAAELPSGPAAVVEEELALDGMDPVLFLENGFDQGHVAAVHGRPGPDVQVVRFDGGRAHLEVTGATFDVYRGSQVLVRLTTARPGTELWVLGAVLAGDDPRFHLRYEGHGDGGEAAVRRFARLHLRETERDFALLRTVRPDLGRWWGPGDGPLRAFRGWVEGLGP